MCTILISGAGIAGPALAHFLLKRGFTPILIDRAPRFREGGYANAARSAFPGSRAPNVTVCPAWANRVARVRPITPEPMTAIVVDGMAAAPGT